MGSQCRAMRSRIVLTGVAAGLCGIVGCAPTQVIPLDVGPVGVSLYLNGEEVEEIPENLKLKANRNHTLFFKRDGYLSQFVLLRSTGEKGDEILSPNYISLELQRLTTRRPNLTLEIEDLGADDAD